MEAPSPVRVLVTGSRKWTDPRLPYATLAVLYECWEQLGCPGGEFIVVQGEAPGLDTICRRWAEEWHPGDPRVDHEPHHARWDLFGNAAGAIRNDEMIKCGADICVGFPTPDSIGTYDCLAKARGVGIPTFDMSEYL